jgi:phosphoribosylformimino-5-aminoimidazole carboxamide ribotide isomerase
VIAIPAVDIREGACVQLVGGQPDQEKVRLADPVAVARRWEEIGFARVHVVDLDAAFGTGTNASIVERILSQAVVPTQVGGGVRDEARAHALLAAGAAAVIVGTRALEDPAWLRTIAGRHPGQIIVAVDVRDRQMVVRGWTEAIDYNLIEVVEQLDDLPLAALLVTAVHREGLMRGPDGDLLHELAATTSLPIYAAGGIATAEHLDRLADLGVAGGIIGMALYTGVLDATTLAKRFGGRT